MPSDTRTTVYLKPKVYRALKVKAATTDRSLSDLVNAAVLESLREDAVDLDAFNRRGKEPSRSFEKVLEELKRDGTL
ncbi:MAG: hypothetical protein WA045_12805 [Nitrospira sp.]|jgi:hypothetical protein